MLPEGAAVVRLIKHLLGLLLLLLPLLLLLHNVALHNVALPLLLCLVLPMALTSLTLLLPLTGTAPYADHNRCSRLYQVVLLLVSCLGLIITAPFRQG
jgi:hypothetical protein